MPNAAVIHIDLFLKSRNFSGLPVVKARVRGELHDENLWTRTELSRKSVGPVKISNDRVGQLDATAILSAALTSPVTAQAGLPKAAGVASQDPSALQTLIKELDDAAKELVKGNAEEIALDLLTQMLRGDEDGLLLQFDAMLQSSINDSYTQVLDVAVSAAAQGLSIFGVDD